MRVPPVVVCDGCGGEFTMERIEISVTESGYGMAVFTPPYCLHCGRRILRLVAETETEEKYRAIVGK